MFYFVSAQVKIHNNAMFIQIYLNYMTIANMILLGFLKQGIAHIEFVLSIFVDQVKGLKSSRYMRINFTLFLLPAK